ncbi:MAG: ABC transporter ATP-binding protein [Bdellovibrionales bacterium]|nr:ABC transporter ATP-binding protein [Bdellovibrionales bacterium]
MKASHGALEHVIDIRDLSKTFRRHRIGRGSYSTLKSLLLGLFRRSEQQEVRLIRAIDDLTIRIPKGSSVGIIGRNGSGKSTLLKLITGIYKPTTGTVSLKGRVSALIELGAGFHPDFTGRENLYLGGAIHGMSRKEIDERFDDIVRFAELEDFIDEPVRTYSSGMFMRLGFSLAVHTDPDILLVDEVLAVGDASFVAKCKDRISQLRKQGITLLLVTHDLAAVERWCDEVVWLHDGEVQDRGDPRRVIDAYREFLERGEEKELLLDHEQQIEEEVAVPVDESTGRQRQRWGSREVEVHDVRMLSSHEEEHLVYHPEDSCFIEFGYTIHEPTDDVVFGIGVERVDGLQVHGTNTEIEKLTLPNLGTTGKVRYAIDRLGLLSGRYSLDIAVHRQDGYPYDYHKGVVEFVVRGDGEAVGIVQFPHRWELAQAGEERFAPLEKEGENVVTLKEATGC